MSKSKSKNKNTQPAVEPVEVKPEVKAEKPKVEKKAVGFLGVAPSGAAIYSPGTHPRSLRNAKLAESQE